MHKLKALIGDDKFRAAVARNELDRAPLSFPDSRVDPKCSRVASPLRSLSLCVQVAQQLSDR